MSSFKLNEHFTLGDNLRGFSGHFWKLVKFRCTRNCCKYSFSNWVIKCGANKIITGLISGQTFLRTQPVLWPKSRYMCWNSEFYGRCCRYRLYNKAFDSTFSI